MKKDDGASTPELKGLEYEVLDFLNSNNIKVQESDISACHTLGNKKSMKPAIVLQLVNRKVKTDILKNAKKLWGTNMYINEHLTKKKVDLAKKARLQKKQGKIESMWTRNCKVLIKIERHSGTRTYWIKEDSDFDKFINND